MKDHRFRRLGRRRERGRVGKSSMRTSMPYHKIGCDKSGYKKKNVVHLKLGFGEGKMERLLSGWKPALITVCKTIQNLGSDQGSLEATAALASLLTHCVLLGKWLDPALGLSVFS